MVNELKSMVGYDETILYEGKPDKKCFIMESIFNPMLPIAILWGVFDLVVLGNVVGQMNGMGGAQLVMIPFMLLHMMPVWIYLSGVITTMIRYKNTYYIVTDYAIYVSRGVFTMNLDSKSFAEMSRVNLHRGVFDQMFNVGDVQITTNQLTKKNVPAMININSISNYSEVFQLVSKLQKDIYSDVMYPNDLRPKENHGYKTKYRG